MLSRDTRVHIVAVLVGLAVFALVELAGFWEVSRRIALGLALVGYAILFGGAHFYLALRGEDGLVPVEARVRYLVMLTVLFLTAAIVIAVPGREIAGVEFSAIGVAVAVMTIVVYVILESRSGYRSSH